MTKAKWQGHAAMLVCSIIFALNIPIAKGLLQEWMHPMGIAFFRITFATVALWITSFFFPSEPVHKRSDFGLFLLGGFLGMSFNQITFIEGLNYTSPVYAAILGTFTPLLTMVLAALILKEPITWRKTIGVVIGASGAIFIIIYGSNELGADSLLGDILCIVSSFSYALYVVLMRPIIMRYSPITLMKWMFLGACVYTVPYGFSGVLESKAILQEAPLNIYLGLLYTVFMATFVTYLLIPYALKRIRPTTVTSYNYLQPLVASFTAIMAGQDTFRWDMPISAIIIFTGVYLVTSSKSKEDIDKELQSTTHK